MRGLLLVALLLLGGCAWTGDAVASAGAVGLAVGALVYGVRVMRSKPNPLLLLVLIAGLAAGCGATPKQIFYTTTIASVQTVDEGIGVFTRWAVGEEAHIADGAIEACKGFKIRGPRQTCIDEYTLPRWEPIDKAKAAIRVYQGAKRAGEAGASVDVAGAAKAVIETIGAVGVKVGG